MIHKSVFDLISFVRSRDGVAEKAPLIAEAVKKFGLTQDRKVFYSDHFAVRFSESRSESFSNTVLSLSSRQKYDDIPFLVCIVTPSKNAVFLANSTLLRKISHSSQQLRLNNIKGSFNGSDIMREFNGIQNVPENFDELFATHAELGFNENLARLVEATTGISPTGKKYAVSREGSRVILSAPERADRFVKSDNYQDLKLELDGRVAKFKSAILVASFIENINTRGRVIEYLISGKEDDVVHKNLLQELSTSKALSRFATKNTLWDYLKDFDEYHTATDVKTKVMVLKSNPKAYNIDKLLEFLATGKSVLLFYFIGIEPNKIVAQSLISIFQKDLLDGTLLQKHWAGRNSRGVAQFRGEIIQQLVLAPNNQVDVEESKRRLKEWISE